MQYHEPVLLQEVLEGLRVKDGGKYIDCTLGDGGHTLEILRRGGKVLGLDVSEESIRRARERIATAGLLENFTGVQANFKNLENIAKENGFTKVDGILFDLGFSSSQLEEAGLSFSKDVPLDMRLDKSLGVTAADLVNGMSEKELTRMFREYGGENLAKKFAKVIVKYRGLKKFQTTKDLADLLVDVAPSGYERGRIHPATRVFQALRIVVNDELKSLKVALPQAARLINSLPGGRIAVLSFHSLEDKIVKEFGLDVQPLLKPVTKKPIVPTQEEVAKNPRARSAKLRVFERVGSGRVEP